MKKELKKFLTSLKESDFNGSKTEKTIQAQAEKFLNSSAYKYNETFNDTEIHVILLCLLYDEV